MGAGDFISASLFVSDFSLCKRVDGCEGSGGGVLRVRGSSGRFLWDMLSGWVARFVSMVVALCSIEDSWRALILRNCCSRGD